MIKMPAFYVYILECIDKNNNISYYTGSTDDLYKRFKQHKSGTGAKYTKGKKLKMVHYEIFTSRKEAVQRELEIKKFSKEKKMSLFLDK